MNKKSMTALVSAFSRAYHFENNEVRIFDDSIVRRLFSDEEYTMISKNMADGITFFNPSFAGSSDMAVRWIVDNQLSAQPLARSAFAEKSLETAVRIGAKQYVILGAGYDTFAYRSPKWAQGIHIFELDFNDTLEDKLMRLERAGIAVPENVHYIKADLRKDISKNRFIESKAFDENKITFCSALGVTCYIAKSDFGRLLFSLSENIPEGSSIVFDYFDEKLGTEAAGNRAGKQFELAKAAGEEMLSGYSYKEIESILSNYGFLVYEHLTPSEMTQLYFSEYNMKNPNYKMSAFDNVNYCLAVKNKK